MNALSEIVKMSSKKQEISKVLLIIYNNFFKYIIYRNTEIVKLWILNLEL